MRSFVVSGRRLSPMMMFSRVVTSELGPVEEVEEPRLVHPVDPVPVLFPTPEDICPTFLDVLECRTILSTHHMAIPP